MDKEDRFTKGLSISVVPETLRIRFTRELNDLREGNVSEVNFPTTLSTVERKFLHSLSQELGLTSKSKGKDEKRYITVTKGKKSGANNDAIIHPFFDFAPQTKNELLPSLANYKHILSSIKNTKLNKKNPKKSSTAAPATGTKKRGNRFASTEKSAEHFQQRQAQRHSNKDYAEIQRKRQSLPSCNHSNDVVEMVRNHQISLISGETGCGKIHNRMLL
jgi:HrpA-like RNA helicase